MTMSVSSQKNEETLEMCSLHPGYLGLGEIGHPAECRAEAELGAQDPNTRASPNHRCLASSRRETRECMFPCYLRAQRMLSLSAKSTVETGLTLTEGLTESEGKPHQKPQGGRAMGAPDNKHQGWHFPEERALLAVPDSNILQCEPSEPREHARRIVVGMFEQY